MDWGMTSDEDKRNAVVIASAVVNGELGPIEGSIRLYALSHNLVSHWHADEDFVVFGGVASETDHFPIGSARQYWNPIALAREDKKIADYESRIKASVISACQNVIARFSALQ
jgi:hypothetical protein